MPNFFDKYPYTDFHELNLDWVLERVKQLTEDWITTHADWVQMQESWDTVEHDWTELYNYVHDYFDNLNVQDEINNKLDEMVDDGTMDAIVSRVLHSSRKYILVGDSYSVMNTGWKTELISIMGLTADDYYDCCVSGSGFTVAGALWIDNLTTLVNGMTDNEKSQITDVVCCGGINDSVPPATLGVATQDAALGIINNSIYNFTEYVKTNLPNAKVSLFYVGNTEEGMDPLGQRYYDNIVRTIHAWEQVRSSNARCFKGSENILHDYTLMAADGIHPNNLGCIEIARFINNCLNGGTGFDMINGFNNETTITDTTGGPAGVYTNGSFKYLVTNGMMNITMNGLITLDATNIGTITEGDEIPVFEFTNASIIHGKSVIIPCRAALVPSGTSGQILVQGVLIMEKGIVSMKIWKIDYDYSQTVTSAVKYIQIYFPNVSYPMIQN